MSAVDVIQRLADVIDGHRWDELSSLASPDFSCRYVHTGEQFDRDAWVRLNADYPGFQDFVLEDCVVNGGRVAARAHVTGVNQGEVEHFGVAMFMTVLDGLVVDLVEVWTHIGEVAPAGRRAQ